MYKTKRYACINPFGSLLAIINGCANVAHFDLYVTHEYESSVICMYQFYCLIPNAIEFLLLQK